MIQYILTTLICTIVILFMYIRLKYPFWSAQPVYHTYDFWRFFYKTPFIIHKYRPVRTKFTDVITVNTIDYSNILPEKLDQVVNLLQCYYISSERIVHTIKADSLDAIFSGQSHPSIISAYNTFDYTISQDTSFNAIDTQIKTTRTPVGCITSRHLQFLYKEYGTSTSLPIYYMDYLCSARDKDQKMIMRKLLQTHEYNQRTMNPDISVSLVKKEVDLFMGIIPFIQYKTHTYHLHNITVPALPDEYHVNRIDNENMDLIVDLFYSKIDPDPKMFFFDAIIHPDIGNITAQIKHGLLQIYCLQRGSTVYGYYFFKETHMYYEDPDSYGMQCVGSIMNTHSLKDFYKGFLHAIRSMLQKNKDNSILILDEIGHNVNLLNMWRYKNSPFLTTDSAYYLLNMVYPGSPLRPERCMVLM